MFLHDCQRTKDINGKLPSNVILQKGNIALFIDSSVNNIRNAIVKNCKDNITIILRYSRK